jgi:hypothetical protein
MKKVVELKTPDKNFKFEESWSSFVLPYISLFLIKHDLNKNERNSVIIPINTYSSLISSITTALSDLLISFYEEPSQRDIQSHSSRYEKIYIENRLYIVNYRMSSNGRLAYALYCLLRFVENVTVEEYLELIID